MEAPEAGGGCDTRPGSGFVRRAAACSGRATRSGETVERLTRRFFARPSEVVARALLGKLLVCGGRAGVVVETEAYLGADNKASHARFGPTSRNAVMFGPGGVAYVYLIYGMYDMFNIVTGRDGEPQAVLVRAVHPAAGIAGGPAAAAGPGKVCRALGISRSRHHGIDLTASTELFLTSGSRVAA